MSVVRCSVCDESCAIGELYQWIYFIEVEDCDSTLEVSYTCSAELCIDRMERVAMHLIRMDKVLTTPHNYYWSSSEPIKINDENAEENFFPLEN